MAPPVLLQESEGVAVFELLSAGNDDVYLRCAQGYLTSSATGNGLYYSAEPLECSEWQFHDGVFLYNTNACYQSGSNTYRNYYLEYYNSGKYYTTYGKRST